MGYAQPQGARMPPRPPHRPARAASRAQGERALSQLAGVKLLIWDTPHDSINSDHAPEYYGLYHDHLQRELAYWLSPEQVEENGWWLAQVLTVIELMLLFEQRIISLSTYVDREKAVQRWRNVILAIWDGEWQEKDNSRYSWDDPEFRKQHRPAIVANFDYLESVARYWTHLVNKGGDSALEPSPPD